jgi:hypothetical protein
MTSEGADVYTVQQVFGLAGPLTAARLKTAAEAMLARPASLRAGFQRRRSGQPLSS